MKVIFSPPSAERWGGVGGGGSIGWNRCFGERRAAPHPRPLPATRDARGGRGVQSLFLRGITFGSSEREDEATTLKTL